MPNRPSSSSALATFRRLLRSKKDPHEIAAAIVALAPDLPEAAIAVMDEELPRAHPLVRVALMDAYFTLTECDWHLDDLDALAERGAREHDDDLLAAASIAAARQAGEPEDVWVTRGFEIVGVAGRVTKKRVKKVTAAESITVVVHGTWARDGHWWRRGGDFFEYLRKVAGVDDLYDQKDRFDWSGDNRDSAREKAGEQLHRWIKARGAETVRIIGHSHGANIASLATHRGTVLDRLVMLSPPVRRDYLPKWANVGHAFNVQAKFDAVVAVAHGVRWFRDVTASSHVKEKRLVACGHSASHDPAVWRDEGLAKFVGLPW